MAQNELPESFVLSDSCIVYRTVKNVTYGELKILANTKKQTVHADSSCNRENIIAHPSRQPRIKALKIKYRIRSVKPFKH